MIRFWKTFAAGLAAVVIAASCATPADQPDRKGGAARHIDIHPAGWANDRGDLPKDPDYTLGVLPNGMRYLILPNRNPPSQVAMRLVIAAGSMQERPGEEGIAHFLEHLAFRGTKLFPDGELQRRLEGLGLQMGADANASTASDRTTFMFNLARSDTESLDTGLLVLREIVSEMTMAPDLVNAERGVVLAEERMRAGPALDATIQAIKLQVGNHPYGRAPIGKREVVEKVTPEQIRVFYDAYYRPERATLVVVGDLKPADIIPAINARFADWKGRGAPGGDPQPVMAKPAAPDVAVQVTPGGGETALALRWFEPYRERPPIKAERRRQLVEGLGVTAVLQRMESFNEAAGKPARFISAAAPSRIPGVWNGQVSQASGVTDLPKAIDVLVTAQRQAVQFGVTQEELDRVKEQRLRAVRQAAATGRTGTSEGLAEAIAAQLSADPVFVSPKDVLALTEDQIKTVTLAEVNAALRGRFSDKPVLIYYGGQPPSGGEKALRAAYTGAMAEPVTAYALGEVKAWPYTNFGTAGKVAERREAADVGVTFVRFENGVRLTVKHTDFQKDDIRVQVRMGLGRLGQPKDRIDASDMGAALWDTGGLGKLTPAEERRARAGRRVALDVGMVDDSFVVSSGFTRPEDFGLQMEMIAATISDPALRADDWASMLASSDRSEESTMLTPGGVMSYNVDRLFHSNDLRWTFNTKAQRDSWKPADAVAWIRPIIANSTLDVTIVGDVSVETAISEVSRTLGALPPRKETPEPPRLRDVKFPGHTPTPIVLTHKGRADQGGMIVAWPTQDAMSDLHAARVGWVLSQMLRDEATREFRSQSGATYSPAAMTEFSDILPGYGFIGLTMELSPEKIDAAFAQIDAIAASFVAQPPIPSEVARVTGPRIEALKRDMTNNGFWMAGLQGAYTDQKRLDVIRGLLSDYESVTPLDIQMAARRWLRPDRAWRLKAVPDAKP